MAVAKSDTRKYEPPARTIGFLCVSLSVIHLGWSLWSVGSSARAVGFLSHLTLLRTTREALFVVTTSALCLIGIELIRGRELALHHARKWTMWALFVVAMSVLIDVAFVVPAEAGLSQPRAGLFRVPPPAISSALFENLHTEDGLWIILTVLGGAVVKAILPIVLRGWVDRR